jgi:hypothetical protein
VSEQKRKIDWLSIPSVHRWSPSGMGNQAGILELQSSYLILNIALHLQQVCFGLSSMVDSKIYGFNSIRTLYQTLFSFFTFTTA